MQSNGVFQFLVDLIIDKSILLLILLIILMVNIGKFFSSPALEQQKQFRDQIDSLKAYNKLAFVDRAPFLTPGYVIEYFQEFINEDAMSGWYRCIEGSNLPTARNFKEILHAIADGLEKSDLDKKVIAPFIEYVKNNSYLDLQNHQGRQNEYLIFDEMKKQCFNLLMRYLKYLESRHRRGWRNMLRRTAGAVGLSMLGKGFYNIHRLRKPYEHTLTEGIPEELDGYVIVNISDIHIHQGNKFNLNEPEEFRAYFEWIKKYLIEDLKIDESKIILVMPGDFLTQNSAISTETERDYAQEVLPLLNILPGKYRYVTGGNHDERHSRIRDLRQWFKSNNYISLDENDTIGSEYILLKNNKKLQVLGIADFLTRNPQGVKEIVEKTKEAIFNILLVHNLDAVDPHLPNGESNQTIVNTYIATGHTHRFHANFWPIGSIINNLMLHFRSQYYQGRYQLENNVHIDNCPGLNNSPIAPFRMRADPGATITYLKYKS